MKKGRGSWVVDAGKGGVRKPRKEGSAERIGTGEGRVPGGVVCVEVTEDEGVGKVGEDRWRKGGAGVLGRRTDGGNVNIEESVGRGRIEV
jgi:hypothetical protein